MPAKASISKGYMWRLGIITVACLVFTSWFAHDGMVGYPAEREMQQKYADAVKESQDDPEALARWHQWACENDWKSQCEGKTPRRPWTDSDIQTQFIYGSVTLAVALFFGFGFVRSVGRWVATDEEAIFNNHGQRASWGSITSLDKSRWKNKGIAVVHYSDQGHDRRITLDDWKFEREATTQMLEEVESHTGLSDSKPDSDSGNNDSDPDEQAG